MKTFEKYREGIENIINEIIQFDKESVLRIRYNEIGFGELSEKFDEAAEILKRILKANEYRIGQEEFAKISSWLNNYKAAVLNIQGYSFEAPNQNQRKQFIQAFDLAFYNLFTVTNIILQSESIWNEKPDTAKKDLEVIRGLVDNAEKQTEYINGLASAAQKATTKKGVDSHSNMFISESGDHDTLARKWLNSVFFCIGAIIVLSIIFMCITIDQMNPTEVVHFSVTKVILFTIFFFALNLCSKNYRIHRHNSVSNKHRHNALMTFETFSKAAEGDAQTKNAVLLIATQAIFSNQSTGYLDEKLDGDNTKILEIFKTVEKK